MTADCIPTGRGLAIHSSSIPVSRLLLTGAVVFFANAALLVLQLMTGRLLAPFVGSSLATWTTVIGVFLAGISAGNWVGGRLADRAPYGHTLRTVLFVGGLCVLGTLGMIKFLGEGQLLRPLPLGMRIVLLTVVVGFPSSFVLSLTTPVAIKLSLSNMRHTGRVVGIIYALGTFGSLAGNFTTGFYLSNLFGTTVIVASVGAVLLVLALMVPSIVEAKTQAMADDRPLVVDPNEVLELPSACALVFVCSFCSMALEIGASRLLAPTLGVSLYTWTGIIGVVLAGMIVGNSLGGWIADRSPKRSTLGGALFWAGLFVMAILALFSILRVLREGKPADPGVGPGWHFLSADFWSLSKDWTIYYLQLGADWLMRADLPLRIVIEAALLFFAPMVAFGTISPLATRLAVRDRAHAGRVAGRIYAWSCIGAIVGTFAAGWFLIGAFGVMRLILGIAVFLIILTIPVGKTWRQISELMGCGVVVAAAIIAVAAGGDRYLRFYPDAVFEKETNYYLIYITDVSDTLEGKHGPVKVIVKNDEGYNLRDLMLDALIHSKLYGKYETVNGQTVWNIDVSYLGYGHEQVQSEFAQAFSANEPHPNVLVIGGGGYTLPRWIDKFLPAASVEVVEIDPGVTEAVHTALGLPRDTRIRTHNLDGRQFVQEQAPRGHYHLVIQDAVNDLSVPAHIMTKQYNDAIKSILAADGIYLLTVIDEFPNGKMLPAALHTMSATFPHVAIVAERPLWEEFTRNVFVIAGSSRAFDEEMLQSALAKAGVKEMITTFMPHHLLTDYVEKAQPIMLTDDYAPVDNLLAETFRRRWLNME